RRGLGDEQDHLRGGVIRESLERLQRGDAADCGMEVATAGADGVRDAAAESMHEARHFLDAGSGGADHADGSAANAVREAEADAVDDGRSALRAHDEEAAPARPA